MEEIGKVLASRATDLLAPSVTWRDETRLCSKCGQSYQARIAEDHGEIKHIVDKCSSCQQAVRLEEQKADALLKLPAIADRQRELWREQCNTPNKFWNKTFANFDGKLQPKAFKTMSEYDWSWDDEIETPPKSLVLLSPDLYGVGKTHLVCALADKIIRTEKAAWLKQGLYVQTRRCPVYFTTETQLLDRIRATFNRTTEDTETEEMIYKQLDSHDLLIIDDVGKVRPKDFSFLQGVYFRVIDGRYTNQQPIILTTNLGYTELEQHIGGACADRLREMCGDSNFIKMAGKSYRRTTGTTRSER